MVNISAKRAHISARETEDGGGAVGIDTGGVCGTKVAGGILVTGIFFFLVPLCEKTLLMDKPGLVQVGTLCTAAELEAGGFLREYVITPSPLPTKKKRINNELHKKKRHVMVPVFVFCCSGFQSGRWQIHIANFKEIWHAMKWQHIIQEEQNLCLSNLYGFVILPWVYIYAYTY